MTLGGWICMSCAIAFVTGLFGWCCWKMAVCDSSPNTERSENENQ